MTNEEKVKKIVSGNKFGESVSPYYTNKMYDAVLEMAEWKDEQWKLRAKTAFCLAKRCTHIPETQICDERRLFDNLIDK